MKNVEAVIEGLRYEVERARAELTRPKGGQQVPPSGDFIRMPPSSLSRLEWWVRALEEAFKKDKGHEK